MRITQRFIEKKKRIHFVTIIIYVNTRKNVKHSTAAVHIIIVHYTLFTNVLRYNDNNVRTGSLNRLCARGVYIYYNEYLSGLCFRNDPSERLHRYEKLHIGANFSYCTKYNNIHLKHASDGYITQCLEIILFRCTFNITAYVY